MTEQDSDRSRLRPSLPLAIGIFLGYTIVFIGVIALTAPHGFSYKHAFGDLKDSRPFIWGLLAGAAFSVAVATALGGGAKSSSTSTLSRAGCSDRTPRSVAVAPRQFQQRARLRRNPQPNG
jgi:hypothetical protein